MTPTRILELVLVLITLGSVVVGAYVFLDEKHASNQALLETKTELTVLVTEARLESTNEDLDDDAWRIYELKKAQSTGQSIDETRLQYLEGQVGTKIRKVERLEQLQDDIQSTVK